MSLEMCLATKCQMAMKHQLLTTQGQSHAQNRSEQKLTKEVLLTFINHKISHNILSGYVCIFYINYKYILTFFAGQSCNVKYATIVAVP